MNCKHVRVIRGLKSARTSRRDFEITLKKIRESLDRALEVLGSLEFEYCGFEPFLRRKKRAISAWRIVVGAFEKNEILTGARADCHAADVRSLVLEHQHHPSRLDSVPDLTLIHK